MRCHRALWTWYNQHQVYRGPQVQIRLDWGLHWCGGLSAGRLWNFFCVWKSSWKNAGLAGRVEVRVIKEAEVLLNSSTIYICLRLNYYNSSKGVHTKQCVAIEKPQRNLFCGFWLKTKQIISGCSFYCRNCETYKINQKLIRYTSYRYFYCSLDTVNRFERRKNCLQSTVRIVNGIFNLCCRSHTL